MKLTDLTKEEFIAIISGRGQKSPSDPEPEINREPEFADNDPEPRFTGEQVDVLRCVDALAIVRELYVPQGSLIQTRVAQAQYLLQIYADIPIPQPLVEDVDEIKTDDDKPPAEKKKIDTYTVG